MNTKLSYNEKDGIFYIGNSQQQTQDWQPINIGDELSDEDIHDFVKWASLFYDLSNRPENPWDYKPSIKHPSAKTIIMAIERFVIRLEYDRIVEEESDSSR